MLNTESTLRRADDMGFLTVVSDHYGVNYVIDPESKRVMIMSTQGRTQRAVILPNEAVRELSEAMKVLCG